MAEQPEHPNRSSTILQRVAENDKSAALELMKSYGNFVYSLAKKFSCTHEDAEDATRDIFLELWKHAGRFDPQTTCELGFIALIAKRRLIDNYREQKARPEIEITETALDTLTVKTEGEFFLKRLVLVSSAAANTVINQL